jgi:hypothetical protein
MSLIATTRFNNSTWNENVAFRSKYNYSGCIYGSPSQLSSKIDKDAVLFIIEMNNTTNKIEGIGVVRNTNRHDKYYCIYNAGNFNRYTFTGKYRMDRIELLEVNPNLVKTLDQVLFKGKSHSKRSDSITLFPTKIMRELFDEIDIAKEIKNIFMEKFRTSNTLLEKV